MCSKGIRSLVSPILTVTIAFTIVILGLSQPAYAQNGYQRLQTIESDTIIPVRTEETVTANEDNGRIFNATVDADVYDSNGRVAIPAGSPVELTVRPTSNNDLILDLESVTVNSERYAVRATAEDVTNKDGEDIGANRKTAEYVGGGALLGTIVGAIAGGGKGAAIGAAIGAAAGAGAQVATRGRSVSIPDGSIVTFRLTRPFDVGVIDTGYMRDGFHYHRYRY